jgi:hypothetical protein
VKAAAALVAVLILAGCSGSRAFVADQRIHIVSPAPLATVAVPFTVSWSGSRPDDRAYAVFVDRAPIAPGQTVRALADTQCKRRPGCPDGTYLAGLGVFVGSTSPVEVTQLDRPGGTAGRAADPVHTLTVVALDGQGRRLGDVSWTTEFRG